MRWRCVWLCVLALFFASVIDVQARLVHNHVSKICSTWGREHFKTFDGDVYQFPGRCEYNLASDCHESYQEFSVHIKRKENDANPTVSYVVVTINDLSFHLSKSFITVNGLPVKMPYYNAGVQVEKNAVYIKLQSKVGIVVMWNGDDAVMVELDRDYANRTCGLCGDFNGVPVYNEFIHNGRKVSPIEFGNKQKVHRPNDDCEDPYEEEDVSLEAVTVSDSCKEFQIMCDQMLRSESWSSCTKLINPDPYIQACVQDLCGCTDSTSDFCACSTLSEFSRQCSHAGGHPPNWRTPQFCAKQCPLNLVYEESGSPCLDTCTHQDTSSLCEDHKMDGCFCPPGTVFDDISMRGCIAQSECQCKHNKIYNSGEVYRQEREECTCFEGRWACKSLQIPATCAVEEGSHVTTFDGKTYTFHGDCYYTLAKVESKDDASPKFTILVQLVPCANQRFDTCLKSLKIVLNNDRNNVLMFTSDGTVKQNMQTISLPYHSGDINIFYASSFHILLQTSFGLQIQIQHVPVMQVYVSLEQSYRAKTRGLCGNYNMILSDDMKTPQGIVEGTAATFCNSWKTNLMCQDKEERLDDPCSLSVENEWYAKHWCALLLRPNSTFAQCHSVVDPEMYYKRCTYASCNCEKSEACLCAVFSSYARACASKGVFLTDWRENVCDKYTRSCPASQTFSYKNQRCQLTCRSLGSNQQSCTNDFLPVDGCSCSDGLYLNENGICVPKAKCSCYRNEVHIKPGKSISIKDEHCVCTNGVLHCHSWRARSSACPFPKVFFNCSTTSTEELGLQCARTCLNLDSDNCDSTECESGCQCPSGLLDDGKGSCVKESDCPCQHDGHIYAPGTQIPNQCNTCTCKSGKWECTEKKCPGTCIIYGSGHYNTFDKKTYGFHGKCAYVAVKNKCGNKTVQDNFGVITENVPCGSTGTTCSKTVRVQLGRMEVKLSKGKYEEEDLGHGTQIQYKIRRVGLYLVIESAIGLAVMWDRKTTVRILLEPQHNGEVCGLCGDFDGDGQNDFITQDQLIVSNPLEFANSWKLLSHCPDAEMNADPCGERPNRHHWAKIMCSIITGNTFKDCHNKVDSRPFYENCVKDSCACDSGGDCECFCTAVAAYAQACNEAGVCVAWRTPEICPVFCDYYNSPDECKWHYNPCHTPCYKTCLNPQGICSNPIPDLEGCYPVCPEDKPIFDEETQMCVEECPGCFYNGTRYEENEVIYNVTDNLGMCYYAICINATVIFGSEVCPTTTVSPSTTTIATTTHVTTTSEPPTTTTTTTVPPTTTTTTVSSSTTPCITTCEWSEWYDVHNPKMDKNDWETYENITNSGKELCEKPVEIDCRSADYPDLDFYDFVSQTGQVVTCDVGHGLICRKEDQLRPPRKCFNYKIRVCCEICVTPPTPPPMPPTIPPSTTTEPPTTTTKSTSPPTKPPTTTEGPTTTTTKSTTLPTLPPSTTEPPTTTTKSTTPPTPPPTTTEGPTTTTTKSTTLPTLPPSTTEPPTTTTKSTTPPTPPPTTTEGPTTTTTKSTTLPTLPPSTTEPPTTTTKSTTPPTPPPTTTQEPTTTTTKSTTLPTLPPSTTEPPTTTTKSTTSPTPPPTTTEEPTTTTTKSTTLPTLPPSTTEPPTTTTKSTTPPTKPPTTTEGPTTTTTRSTTLPTLPPSTTEPPTTTTKSTTPPTKPTTTTVSPSTTTIATTTQLTTTSEPPTTTTTTTVPPTTTTVSSSTTPCITTCEWSEWYDVHNPKIDKNDWETYENITNSGKEICEKPVEIDCRSADYPDLDFYDFVSQTGQVVTCDVGHGLICRKEDQLRPPRKCFNYKIRVCCEICVTPPTPPPMPPTIPPSTTTEPPTTTTKSTSPPTKPPTTTEGPTTTTTKSTTLPTLPPSTTEPPTTTTKTPSPPTKPPTTTEGPTTTTTLPTSPPSTTEPPTTTTKSTTPPTPPPTTTEKPTTTTTTESTPPPTPPPTTTKAPTTTTKSTTLPTLPPSTTEPPTTTTKSTTPPTAPPTTTEGPTTTTTLPTRPPSTTEPPTTTTKSTTPPTAPPTTTEGPTTTTTLPTPPPSTTEPPTTTTKSTTPPTAPPTTTEGPTTTTTLPTPPPSTTEPPTTTTKSTTPPTPPPTTTERPTTTTTLPTPPPSTTEPPTTTTKSTTPPTAPPTTTEKPTTTTTTESTPPPTPPPTTTKAPTTTTKSTTLPTLPPSTTEPPTTTTKSTSPPTAPPTTTEGPTTTTTLPTPPPTTTEPPTTTTKSTTPPTAPPTTTEGPTTTTTLPTPPPSTTEPPTTTTKSTTPPTAPPTTTEGPTTTTTLPTPPPSTTEPPTTTTKSTTPPTAPPTTTEGPTTTTTKSTSPPTAPPTTTEGPTTTTTKSTTLPTLPPSTTELPTATTKTTSPPTKPPTTTEGPTTTTTLPTLPPSTTEPPTTTTKSTTPPTAPPTTTEGPTTTTTLPTLPPSTTEPPTTTTKSTTSPTPPPTTTEGPTTVSRISTTLESEVTGPTVTPSTAPVINPTTITPSTTTECFCIVNGKHYRPGQVIFDMEHIGSGICLTMICSDICEIHNKTDYCPSTTMPTPTPYVPTCPEWDVLQNETFLLCNCTMARCIENNTIEIIPYECPPIESITCTNGKKPVLVYDEYHCCQHYACDCVCEGWGDPHYITFDGLYYSYQGNCTYVLMEEILPQHNLKIYIDNVFCDPTEDVSCPRSLIISYGSQVITLKNNNLIGAANLEALKDGVHLKLPYSQGGVKVLNSGLNLILEIPRLKVVITFGITGFSVTLPFQYFGKNTQGHCGTCSNNQADDCMLPGGKLVESCAVMADYWPAKDIYQPNCQIPPVLPTSKPEPPPTLTPCKPDSMCGLLTSSVFAECHPFVSPDKFYQGCVFDSCHVSNPAVECTSLQTYAAACAQAGLCLHWRNYTTLCASNCPSDKVYKPCGPAEQPTCEDNPNEPSMNFTTEGCFCPDGMKLFNKESDICVDKCGCLDPDGIPREFNERFEYKCQNCICEESTKTVTCKPKECPAPPLTNCTGPGFVLVNHTNPSDSCCSAFVCQCHSNTCPVISMNCPVGYIPIVSVPEGKCCPEHTCEPKRVCVHKYVEYQPGSSVPVQICQDCICTNEVDPHSGLFKISCEFQQCQETCDMGYEYVETDLDECCGKCVQTHCVLNVNGTTQLLMEGQTWSPPESKCEHYTCAKSGETLMAISSHIVCPPFQQSNCQPDTIQTAANGCCKICVEKDKACKIISMKTRVMHNGCQSYQEVDMPYCEGSCNTFTKYSEAAATMQHSCSCCKETRATSKTVDLHCLNGDVIPYTYVHVEECGCGHTDCTGAAGQPARRRRSFTLV